MVEMIVGSAIMLVGIVVGYGISAASLQQSNPKKDD